MTFCDGNEAGFFVAVVESEPAANSAQIIDPHQSSKLPICYDPGRYSNARGP